MPATGLKKSLHGGNKWLKKQGILKRFSWENVQLLIKLIDIRSSYIRDVLERQGLSEEKMGRGSPICERVRKKIVKRLIL